MIVRPGRFSYRSPSATLSFGYGYTNAEAATLVAAMSTEPDDTRKGHIDTLIGSLKSYGLWTKLDRIYIAAAHHEQASRLEWKNPGTATLTAEAVGGGSAPTFTVDQGWTGNGGTVGRQDMATGFNHNAIGANFTQNSASVHIWSRTNSQEDRGDMGIINYGAFFIRLRSTANIHRVRLNTGVNFEGAVTDSSGLFSFNRSSSTALQSYRNGSSITTGSATSASLENDAVVFLDSPNVTDASARQHAAWLLGGSLDATETANLYTALSTYMTAVGA